MNTYLLNNENATRVLPGIIFLIAFALGSVPIGLIVARIFKVKDLTRKGSGNIGATNVSRVVGVWPAGVITLVLDVAKGVFAVLLAMPMGIQFLQVLVGSADSGTVELSHTTPWLAGLFVVLGHCYSPWLQFKGGKGVATGLGAFLVLSPLSALFGVIGFIITFLSKRIVSLASIAGVVVLAITYLIFNVVTVNLLPGAMMLLIVLIRHEANIDALLENREQPFK